MICNNHLTLHFSNFCIHFKFLCFIKAGIKKGAANPLEEKVADFTIEQVIKVANMKSDSLLGKNIKEKSKEIAGTCQSMGVTILGKPALETIREIQAGKYDDKF